MAFATWTPHAFCSFQSIRLFSIVSLCFPQQCNTFNNLEYGTQMDSGIRQPKRSWSSHHSYDFTIRSGKIHIVCCVCIRAKCNQQYFTPFPSQRDHYQHSKYINVSQNGFTKYHPLNLFLQLFLCACPKSMPANALEWSHSAVCFHAAGTLFSKHSCRSLSFIARDTDGLIISRRFHSC